MVRLGFVILAFTGAGILLYAVGWVLIPPESEDESIADRALRGAVDGPAWLGGLLLLVGAILIASHTRLVAPSLIWASMSSDARSAAAAGTSPPRSRGAPRRLPPRRPSRRPRR
jgi:hypothetical protein